MLAGDFILLSMDGWIWIIWKRFSLTTDGGAIMIMAESLSGLVIAIGALHPLSF